MSTPPPEPPATTGFTPVLDRNIAALVERRRHMERTSGVQEKLAGAISRFTGSMPFVYLHLGVFGGWIFINLGWTPLPKFDPSFVVLAMVASVEAIFLSTFVLITQNRLSAEAERRAELDLHISLLAEHEITTLLRLVTAIAEKTGVPRPNDPGLESLKQDVPPEKVLERLDASEAETRRPK